MEVKTPVRLRFTCSLYPSLSSLMIPFPILFLSYSKCTTSLLSHTRNWFSKTHPSYEILLKENISSLYFYFPLHPLFKQNLHFLDAKVTLLRLTSEINMQWPGCMQLYKTLCLHKRAYLRRRNYVFSSDLKLFLKNWCIFYSGYLTVHQDNLSK